ncbi:PH domain-containing protein [Staphylospora marina]|uniref:PH domain-containing protein n=1 Tax=Staphylospora marina TaxID=2490858 RepID=UPI000F5BACD7|nr:PH domain-containing protein [Staphylospora marina]
MFKKMASDMLGLSDIGTIIKPEDYDKVDADDYVMHEDGEKIYFLIKSKSDEYCFTNKALIHLDGTSATNKKRTLRRWAYDIHPVTKVSLETAGNLDMDVEIKFHIGTNAYSIDVRKDQINELKDLYKALLKIEEIQRDNKVLLELAQQSLDVASGTLRTIRNSEESLVGQFKELNEAAFSWLVEARNRYSVKDFGHVFELFINN